MFGVSREGDWRDSTNMLDMDRRLRHDKVTFLKSCKKHERQDLKGNLDVLTRASLTPFMCRTA